MKKIIYAAKIGLGTAMVIVTAYSLNPFRDFVDLIFGAGLMLAGVVAGVLLERKCRRIFFLFSSLSLLLTFSLSFFPLLTVFQYFPGGLLIYFACAMALSGKKLTACSLLNQKSDSYIS